MVYHWNHTNIQMRFYITRVVLSEVGTLRANYNLPQHASNMCTTQ
jgi:hypothetical protein